MSQANVRSIEAIKEFKLALLTYAEDARVALGAMEMEIRQVRNWLERDQYSYWQSQVKRCKQEIGEARSDLHRRQLSQANSDAVSDSDQKEALRVAKRKLEEAEDKVARIKKWVPILEHALSEYHSQSQPLSDRLSGGVVGSLALLERMIVVLEEYMAIEAPSAPVLPPTSALDSPPPPSGPAEPAPRFAAPVHDRPQETAAAGTPSAEESVPGQGEEPIGEETSTPTS